MMDVKPVAYDLGSSFHYVPQGETAMNLVCDTGLISEQIDGSSEDAAEESDLGRFERCVGPSRDVRAAVHQVAKGLWC